MEKLVNIFNEIRGCYFPRWDIKREWTIEVIPFLATFLGRRGLCNYPKKEIWIRSPTEESNDGLYTLIIHEICHATVSHKHSKKFLARLLKAADKAQAIGETNLANEIRQDVHLYTSGATYDKLLVGVRKNSVVELS